MNKIRNNVVFGNFIVDEKEISKYYADIKELLIQDGENVDCFTTKEELVDKLYYKLINEELEREYCVLKDASSDVGVQFGSCGKLSCC